MAKVQQAHKDVQSMGDRWRRCRDVVSGSDAVKAKRGDYLPELEGGGSGYEGYLSRAMFYPAGKRTVIGLAGMLLGKPITISKVPESFKADMRDVTLDGVSLLSFIGKMGIDLLSVGRVGVLIDMPDTPSTTARPYWTLYRGEQVVNWRVKRINGKQTLVMLVLQETREVAVDDFAVEEQIQYRVLRLDEQGNYTTQTWTRDANQQGEEYIGGPITTPTRKGKPLKFIPFVCLNDEGVSFEVKEPPLLDLFDVNLSHYRTSADREHGAHFTALPTAVTIGANTTTGPLSIGSGVAWDLPMGADAKMLEFSGAGLASLKDIMEEKRQLMATLGARMLETQKNSAEAAQTVRLRHAGERSALQIMAEALSLGASWLMRWHLFWSGMSEEEADAALVELNPDVMDELSAADMQALVSSWQAGAISHKTLYYNMQWGEWTRPGVTFEQEKRDIDREGAADVDDGTDPAKRNSGGSRNGETNDDEEGGAKRREPGQGDEPPGE
jgi:hypothetical protein